MNNYESLFQKALPQIKFRYSEQKIVYEIKYNKVIENDQSLDVNVFITRVNDDIKVSVVMKILLSLLSQEMDLIVKKYMGIKKVVKITSETDLNDFL